MPIAVGVHSHQVVEVADVHWAPELGEFEFLVPGVSGTEIAIEAIAPLSQEFPDFLYRVSGSREVSAAHLGHDNGAKAFDKTSRAPQHSKLHAFRVDLDDIEPLERSLSLQAPTIKMNGGNR